MTIKTMFTSGALALLLAACGGSEPSQQLRDARDAYADARRGPAAQHAPDMLVDAQSALEQAEQADDGSERERHLAYLAIRKANLAEAKARMRSAEQERTMAQRAKEEALRMRTAQAEAAQQAAMMNQQQIEQELARVNAELAAKGDIADERTRLLEQRQAELEAKQAELEAERKARMEAEQQAQVAMQKLDDIAKIEQDPRGIKLTLSGEVLFRTGESELLPTAKNRLSEVATALAETEQEIVIEGHTDARGSAEFNQQLSKSRAEAVKTFLISQGVASERIVAVGMGESQPVADNRNAEGRANNRRVEIIVRGQRQALR